MDEENGETLHQEEFLASITNGNLILEANDSESAKIENTQRKRKFDIYENDYVWGIKQSENKYKTVNIKNELFALNDCVCCRSGLELDYIGKIMKLSQENDQKVCTLRWFFRPFELPTSLQEIYKAANTKELFLALGEGIGVENKNHLVSCHNISNIRSFYNVENVVSLGVITCKCKVLCTAKDDFNDLPSSEQLNLCDFFFSKAFNCDTLQLVALDAVVDAIGAQKVYNKKEWLNGNKIESLSNSLAPFSIKTLHGSHTLTTNSSDTSTLPLGQHNSSSTIIKQSTKKMLTEKRKRDSIEKLIPSPKMGKKIKKIKLSSSMQNLEFSIAMSLTSHLEDKVIKKELDEKTTITTSKNGKIEKNLRNCGELSSYVPITLEQATTKVENNADDIHVTCQGFPKESFFEPIEKSESSTSQLNDKKYSKLIIEEYNDSIKWKSPNSIVKKMTTFAKEENSTSKILQKKKRETSSSFSIDIVGNKFIKKKFVKCNFSNRSQNRRKKVITKTSQEKMLDTKDCDESQKNCEDIMNEHKVDCLVDQQPLKTPLASIKPIIIDENFAKEEYCGTVENIKNIMEASKHNIIRPLEQNFEYECEDWNTEIQVASRTKRILLLHNIDPTLHSIDLEATLSRFLDTKCQVQKFLPNCFYYTSTLALLKFSNEDIAQKSLQNLCKDSLMVGERSLIATLYDGVEYRKELYCFHGHICIQPKCEMIEHNQIEMDFLPHVAEGKTIEFAFGLQWRLLQEQHELQWQLLNKLHEKEIDLYSKETKSNKSPK